MSSGAHLLEQATGTCQVPPTWPRTTTMVIIKESSETSPSLSPMGLAKGERWSIYRILKLLLKQ